MMSDCPRLNCGASSVVFAKALGARAAAGRGRTIMRLGKRFGKVHNANEAPATKSQDDGFIVW